MEEMEHVKVEGEDEDTAQSPPPRATLIRRMRGASGPKTARKKGAPRDEEDEEGEDLHEELQRGRGRSTTGGSEFEADVAAPTTSMSKRRVSVRQAEIEKKKQEELRQAELEKKSDAMRKNLENGATAPAANAAPK